MTEESGRLARWLRLMGFDAAHIATYPLSAVYCAAHNEGRVILTRNRRVKPGARVRVVQVERTALEGQLQEVLTKLSLRIDDGRMFSRCDRCNVPVEGIEKARVKARVPDYVYQTQEDFHACPSCHRIYWAATHWERAQRLFDRLRRAAHDA
ncbi:MAG: hypothetical protein HYY91_03890 [Candidatus Omnitrophica bacterium]|nr:hypothetical protein [Candidatus Omnitrophota bacterium]